ncbi:hypothetical protein GGI42DRAFT_366147 [Trichoderma sp. SZMC 28013]
MESRNVRFDEVTRSLSDLWLSTEEYWKLLEEIFPDKEEHDAYLRHGLEDTLPHLVNPSGILTPARFIEIADSINFLNPTEYKGLLPGLTWAYRPWIPLGYEDTTFYRLLPSIHNLAPQKDEYPSTNYEVLDPAFLGINTTVQPREPSLPLNRRAPNLPEESTQPTESESDDAAAPGFVFHELGTLQCLECEAIEEIPTTPEEGDDREGEYEPTGFSVVARLDNTGHIDGVYVVYNMKPRFEGWGRREQVTDGSWGIPPSSPGEQFSCARIGGTLRDFGFKFKLAWNEQIHHPVELVWVVKSPTGGAMRVTVDGNDSTDEHVVER